MAQTSPFSASKESKAILLSKTTFAREFRDICCPAVAFAVDSAMVAKVKDTILITYLFVLLSGEGRRDHPNDTSPEGYVCW